MAYTVERIPIGITGIDKFVSGGFEKDSANMIRGGTGTGKTIFSLQFLYTALKSGKNAVYISFGESKNAVYSHGKMFGWDFEKYEKKNMFGFLRYPPHEVARVVEGGGGTIKDLIESLGARSLVVDSLSAYAMPFQSEYAANQSILDLFEMLRNLNCTTLVTSETVVSISDTETEKLGYLMDSIINLYYTTKNRKRTRFLEILKMRNTNHSTSLHGYEITTKGIVIKS